MRKQYAHASGGLRWQSLQDVIQIGVDVMAVEPRQVNRAHESPAFLLVVIAFPHRACDPD